MSARAIVLQDRPILDEEAQDIDDVAVGVGCEEDRLDDDERRALDAAIADSLEQAANGLVTPAAHVLARLRARRG